MEKLGLFLQDMTERPIGVDADSSSLVIKNTTDIVSSVLLLINDRVEYSKMAKNSNPYGECKSSYKILNFIKKIING